MSAVLYAAWPHPSGASSTEAPRGETFMEALGAIEGVGHTALYQIAQGGPAMKEIAAQIHRLQDGALAASPPVQFVLAELASLDAAVDVGRAFGADVDRRSSELSYLGLLEQALFHEIDYVAGPAENDDGFAPAVQFGVLSVRDLANEWQINEWYERLRLISVAMIPGQVRTRRYVSVCGRAKYAILYEFTSLEARLTGFEEPHESRALDDSHPTSALRRYTVHAPGAPYVAWRVQ